VVRTIQFDEYDDHIQLAKSDVTGSVPEPQVGHSVPCIFDLECNLLNGAISNYLELPLTQISKSCHYLMLNISETIRDRDTVTMEY